jgi:hypothetical protein
LARTIYPIIFVPSNKRMTTLIKEKTKEYLMEIQNLKNDYEKTILNLQKQIHFLTLRCSGKFTFFKIRFKI